MRSSVRPVVIAAVAVLSASAPCLAREASDASRPGRAAVQDLLEAEQAGLVTVRYIPNDSRSAQVIVTNRATKPLTLRLPAAFAGVPVLAQMGMGMGGMGMGGAGAGFGAGGMGGAQAMGGGMGGGMGGMGGGMGGMGGGAFAIPPEKTRVLRVTTVCLEHGKPEPSPRLPYRLVEVEAFSTDPKVAVMLEALGRGEVSQKVAQAAAWHLASGLSWERLAAEKIDHAGGVADEPAFTPAELLAAHRFVALVTREAAARQPAEASLSDAAQ